MKKGDPTKTITDIVMFDGAPNVQLGGELLTLYCTKLTVMPAVEQTASLFFNDISKIPIAKKIITAHKEIYKIFGSGIYHNPQPILKPKPHGFHDRNIGIFSGEMIP